MLLSVLLMTGLIGLASCDGGDGSVDYSNIKPEANLRIVSLSPALTQILVDLGQGKYIVGVSQNDAAAPKQAKVVGTYLNINAEQIMSLRPTLVFTMSGRDGPPARLKELATNNFALINYPYPKTPTDVGDIIFRESEMNMAFGMGAPAQSDAPDQPGQTGQLASGTPGSDGQAADPSKTDASIFGKTPPSKEEVAPSIGAILDLLPQAMKLKYTMLMRLGAISKLATTYDKTHKDSPNVLLVIGANPVMASGPGTVLDQLLSMAGGHNVAHAATVSAPTYNKEKLLALEPDVVLFIDPNGQPLGDINSDSRLTIWRGLKVPAVKYNRIILISDPMAMLPTSTLDKTAGIMAKALHPSLTEQIDQILKSSMTELSRKNDIDALSSTPASSAPGTPGSPGSPGSLLPGNVNEPAQGTPRTAPQAPDAAPNTDKPASQATTEPAAT